MSELIKFEFEGRGIRTVTGEDGEPWFCAKDISEALGLTNGREMLTSVDDDEKRSVRISDGTSGNPNFTFISEPALYGIVFRSTKPEAKRFSKWVRSEVLPSIRKTGSYVVGGGNSHAISVPSTEAELVSVVQAVVRSYVQERVSPIEADLNAQRKQTETETARATREHERAESLLSERSKVVSDMRSAERARDIAMRKLDGVAKHAYRAIKEAQDEFEKEHADMMAKQDAGNVTQFALANLRKDGGP